MNTFYHSGRIGDIIYSLPTIQAMGGGRLVTGLHPEAHRALEPLLKYQFCLTGVGRIEEEGLPRRFINLDNFRQAPGLGQIHIVNAHLQTFGFPDYDFNQGGWLTLPWRDRYHERMAVINFTGRYQDQFFRWHREARRMKRRTGKVLFLGSQREYDHFPGKEHVDYIPTADLLDASQYVRRAQYFSGSQSALLAIRQGLGLPYRMEQSPNHSDCNQFSHQETVLNPVSRKIHLFLVTVKKLSK